MDEYIEKRKKGSKEEWKVKVKKKKLIELNEEGKE